MNIENCRTKEELVNYFVERGKNITEEEIQTLKNYYEKIGKKNNCLNLKQLDKVSGGAGSRKIHIKTSENQGGNNSGVGSERPPIKPLSAEQGAGCLLVGFLLTTALIGAGLMIAESAARAFDGRPYRIIW